MIDWDIVLQILNTIILIIIGFFLRSYLPKYFEKKGENRATKEDTGEITGIDESVRSKIAEIRNERDEYFRERRAYLLKFYDLSIEFHYENLAVNFGDFPFISDDGRSMFEFQKSFYEKVSELIKSYQRIVIYFDNKSKVRVNAEKILLQVLQARIVMKEHFGDVKRTAIEENQAMLSQDKSRKKQAIEASDKANEKYWGAMKPIIEEYFESLKQYLTSVNEFLRPNEFPKVPTGMFINEK